MAQRHNAQRSTFLCDYFDEDIVYRISKRGKAEFGVIVESCENASSDEEDDDWSDKPWKRLKPGLTKIAWHPKGNSEVIAEKKVKLYDRSLLPGDVVRHLHQASNYQRGYCKETKVLLAIKVHGTDKIIENVDCSHFIPLSAVSTDVVCLYKTWIGYVIDMKHSVTLRFDEGSLATVMMDDICDFEDMWNQKDDCSEFFSDLFYVGQQLCGPKKCLKKANWLSMSKDMRTYLDSSNRLYSRIKATVIDVNVVSLTVKWLCCLSDASTTNNDCNSSQNTSQSVSGGDSQAKAVPKKINDKQTTFDMEPPSTVLTGDDILLVKSLNYFQKCSLQVGDEGYYVIKEGDQFLSHQDWNEKVTQRLMIGGETVSTEQLEQCDKGPKNMDINDETEVESDSQFVDYSDEESMCVRDERSVSSSNSTRNDFKKKKSVPLPVKKIRKKKLKPSKRRDLCNISVDLNVDNKVAVEVIAERTTVTVVWQNGDVEEGISSSLLYPIHHLDNHDFFPGDFVIENVKDFNEIQEYGVIQRVDHFARTASVKWFRMFDANTSSPQLIKVEDLSVYDIKDHPDFNFRPGCCVIRVAGDHFDRDNVSNRAGQVIDLTVNGQLLCAWADGSQSYVYPQELYIIGEYDSDDLWADSEDFDASQDHASDDSWETESEQTLIDLPSPDDKKSLTNAPRKSKDFSSVDLFDTLRRTISQLEEWFSQNRTISIRNSLNPMQKIFRVCRELKAIDDLLGTNLIKMKDLQSLIDTTRPPPGSPGSIQLVASKISRIVASMRDESFDSSSKGSEAADASECSTPSASNAKAMNNTDVCLELLKKLKSQLSQFCVNVEAGKGATKEIIPDEVNETTPEDEKEKPVDDEVIVSNELNSYECGTFDLMESVPGSHKFALSIFQPSNATLFAKQVRKEVMLLQSSLPANIFVKTFTDRMDLFSVMIKGSKRTPYEDGLFLFDIQLPSNYPNIPPAVHYLSFCSDRLNPNLYENGKVCVSLLGTWSGRGTEVWLTTSNLLQVLISIQGLILVDEPYYNEAGYLKQRGTVVGQENSRLYNEMAVVKLVQSMSKLLLYPGDVFCDEIREHFQQNAKRFVDRLEKWLLLSNNWNKPQEELNKLIGDSKLEDILPEFPLLPASQGFCLSLQRALYSFKDILRSFNINVD